MQKILVYKVNGEHDDVASVIETGNEPFKFSGENTFHDSNQERRALSKASSRRSVEQDYERRSDGGWHSEYINKSPKNKNDMV